MNDAGVPCGPIYAINEVFDDPQVRHLGMARGVSPPPLGEVKLVDQAVMMSRTPSDINRATPDCGEHTDEILAEFGLNDEEIAALREAGAI